MNTQEKGNLTRIGKAEEFKKVIEKLTLDLEINEKEKSYILSCAILFLKEYERDKRLTSYADFAYYIILKYSLAYQDFKPLYDFSVNFGFYPISNALLKLDLVNKKIEDVVIESRIEEFKNRKDEYIETLEQFKESHNFLEEECNEKSYIAPTSFGKSSIIEEYIKRLGNHNLKIAIIVPTKSLLVQTHKMIKNAELGKKILIHNEMYNKEESFIGVFTQERALRLLAKEFDISYDILSIDEAHNLFDGVSLKDDDLERGILLTRLLSLNKKRNNEHKIVYLSPLIENVNNLKLREYVGEQEITSHMIHFNIKEPAYFEYTSGKDVYMYNRFVNEFYKIREELKGKFEYLKNTSKEKNFLYQASPKEIESLAVDLAGNLPDVSFEHEINDLVKVLEREVNPDFYVIKTLKSGIIYLHGKIPDVIKEYLEHKFSVLDKLRYVVANTVILEGINLPIDNLYIFNTVGLQGKGMTNLIGRVNRLNEIFTKKSIHFDKLLPSVHFINNETHNKKTGNHNSAFLKLRSRIFKDEVKNPMLKEYDMEKDISKKKIENRERYREKIILTQSLEKKVLEFNYQDTKEEKEKIFDYFNN